MLVFRLSDNLDEMKFFLELGNSTVLELGITVPLRR